MRSIEKWGCHRTAPFFLVVIFDIFSVGDGPDIDAVWSFYLSWFALHHNDVFVIVYGEGRN
jgi:hypothetical protein